MGIYVARHGVSRANDKGDPAFGSPKAHLLEKGRVQARELGSRLPVDFGIDPSTEPVAVSEFTRTIETAEEAGFLVINRYAVLDEVKHGLDLEGFQEMKKTRVFPLHAMRAGEATLNSPPEERIWVCHGLKIAAMCQILGVYQDGERLFQQFCDVRYLPIGD